MRTERYELRDEPARPASAAAASAWCGSTASSSTRSSPARATGYESDPPWGIFGGHDGINASMIRNAGTDDEEPWPSKVTGRAAGPATRSRSPCRTRPATATRSTRPRAVLPTCSTTSPRRARERDYGVVIDAESMTLETRGDVRAAFSLDGVTRPPGGAPWRAPLFFIEATFACLLLEPGANQPAPSRRCPSAPYSFTATPSRAEQQLHCGRAA